MTYPRTHNGYVDDGSLIRASNRRDRCPNCGSDRYRETVSMECCESCGLQMDYWGGGGNEVYERYLAREHARWQEERDASVRQMIEDMTPPPDWDDDPY